MFNRLVWRKALRNSWPKENITGWTLYNQSSVTSRLFYDIFGGEILKTPGKRGWYFYNRLNGKLIDFTKSGMSKSHKNNYLEDIPSTPEEINVYFSQEDYSTFFIRFIQAFEEAVGLRKCRTGISA